MSFARLFGESASPAMSGTTPERSRMRPSLSIMPGFSLPGAPKRTSFMRSVLSLGHRRVRMNRAHCHVGAVYNATPRRIADGVQNAPGKAPPSISRFCPVM